MKENRRTFLPPAEGEEHVPEIADGERIPRKKRSADVLFKLILKQADVDV